LEALYPETTSVLSIRAASAKLAFLQLSLSRLNHRLLWDQAHPEVVEGAAEFHHEITDASLPQAEAVFDNAAALDTTFHRIIRP
jgi:hypothetical protein